MNKRKKYLDLFNLPENASPDEVRKRYRTLAKKYHPDKNKSHNATELFQLLNEAYEYLQNPIIESIHVPTTNSIKEEEIRMERIRKAKERLKEQQKREYKKTIETYQKLTSGLQWKIFSLISYICFISSLLLLIEPILPKRIEKTIVTHYSENYNGLSNLEISLFKTKMNRKIFIESDLKNKLQSNDTINIIQSIIFHNPIKILHQNKGVIHHYNVDFTATTFYPFLSILFLLPLYIRSKKKLSASYIFSFKFSFYVIESFFLYFLFSNDRWIHLITLGFV